ncbi:UNVERIFIED_CONTAM: hypothetical protein Slati_1676000 [Sesamum latifolium]|uniref:DUF4283 domain-containing protein n=1 Tax=Sesamum latifolium TaxID=2727402 RepID=A0AAW2X067_9LAMI
MESLSKLKKKWMESLEKKHSNIVSSSRVLRPVTEHIVTPFHSLPPPPMSHGGAKNVASALQEEMEAPNKEMGSPIKEGDLGNQRKNPLPNLNMDGARIVEQKVVADRGVQMEMTAPNKERNLGNGRKVLEDARKMDGHPWQPTPLMNEVKPTSSNGIFIGSIPLKSQTIHEDVFANGFNNSTRKTLSYIPPESQNGEIVIRPSMDLIRDGSRRWNATAVGYFLGKKPFFHHLNEYVRSTVAAMEEVIEGGPWLFQGQPIVLQRWEPGMALRKHKHTQVPVWIKLRHLPVEFWTTEGLSMVASGIGRPLYPDAITKACTRLDFARVCIMLDISSKLPKHVVILAPTEEGERFPVGWISSTSGSHRNATLVIPWDTGRVIVRILLGPQSNRSWSMCNMSGAETT